MKVIFSLLILLLFISSPSFAKDVCDEWKKIPPDYEVVPDSPVMDWGVMCSHRPKAEAGDPEHQYYLGLYYTDETSIGHSYEEAVKWLDKAARQNYWPAQETLGKFYLRGQGVKRNEAEAAKLFQSAAKAGDIAAQMDLAELYLAGKGISQDYEEAYFWTSLANYSTRNMKLVIRPGEKREEEIAAHLTSEQIADIKKKVSEWKPVKDNK